MPMRGELYLLHQVHFSYAEVVIDLDLCINPTNMSGTNI